MKPSLLLSAALSLLCATTALYAAPPIQIAPSVTLPISTATRLIDSVANSGRPATIDEIKLMRELASKGVVPAAVWLASELERVAPALALEVLIDAAAVGSGEAAFRAAALMRRWPGVEWLAQWPRMTEAELLSIAAAGGGEYAAAACRLKIYNGGGASNYSAIGLAACAATSGSPDDMFVEAQHRLRRGEPGDREQALTLLAEAAGMGHEESVVRLAEALVAEGPGDYFRAAGLLSRVMSTDDPDLRARADSTLQVIIGMATREALGLDMTGDRRVNLGDREYTATIKASTLSVREGPGQSLPVVGSLTGGQKARVLARQGAWYQVVPPGRPTERGRPAFGWVYAGCVSVDAPPGPAVATDREIIPYGLLPCG